MLVFLLSLLLLVNITLEVKLQQCFIPLNLNNLKANTFTSFSKWIQSQNETDSDDYDENIMPYINGNASIDEMLEDIKNDFGPQKLQNRYFRSVSVKPHDFTDNTTANDTVDYEKMYKQMELPLSKYIQKNIEILKKESNVTELSPSEIVDYAENLDLTEACKPKDYSDILYSVLDSAEITPKISECSKNNLYKQCTDMIAEQDKCGFRFPFGGTVEDMYSQDSVFKSWGRTNIEATSPINKAGPGKFYGYYNPQDKSLSSKLYSNQYYEDTEKLKSEVNQLRSSRFDKSLNRFELFPKSHDTNLLNSFVSKYNNVIIKANQLISENSVIDKDLSWMNPYNPWDELIHLQQNYKVFTNSSNENVHKHFYNEYIASFIDNEKIMNLSETLKSSVHLEDVLQYYGETDDIKSDKNPFKSKPMDWDPDEMPFDRLFALIYPPHANLPPNQFNLKFPRTSNELDEDLKQDKQEALPWVINSGFYVNNLDTEYSNSKRNNDFEELGEAEGMGSSIVEPEGFQKFSDRVARVPMFDFEFVKYKQSFSLAIDALESSRKCLGYSYSGDIFRDQRFAFILDVITKALALEFTRLTHNILLEDIQQFCTGNDKLVSFNCDLLANLLKILSLWNVKGADFIYEFSALILLHQAQTSTIYQIMNAAVPIFNRLTLTENVKKKWLAKLLSIIDSRLSEYVVEMANKDKIVSGYKVDKYLNFKQFLPLIHMCWLSKIPYNGFFKKLLVVFPDEIKKFYLKFNDDKNYAHLFTLSRALLEITSNYNELIAKSILQVNFNEISADNALLAFKILDNDSEMGKSLSRFKGIILEKKYDLSASQILELLNTLKDRKDKLGLDGIFVYNLLEGFRGVFRPTFDQLFEAFELVNYFKVCMSKQHVNNIAKEFIKDSTEYTLISHVGLNAEYLGYPFFVTARLLKLSSICGFTDLEVWQSFYELLEMHKHTLNMDEILEILDALVAANFNNIDQILHLLVSRAADIIECTRVIDKLDVILSIMDRSNKLGLFPRELLRWTVYSILYDKHVNSVDISSTLNDPETKQEQYCFRGIRCEQINKRLIQTPQHSFNFVAFTDLETPITEKSERQKFDYSLLGPGKIPDNVTLSQLNVLFNFINQLVHIKLPLKIERRLYLNLLDLMHEKDSALYNNLLQRLVPSKIVSDQKS